MSQSEITLDRIDLKILQVLQENGRLSNVELSERVALSPSPCLRRLKQLEDMGIIRRYAALLSPVSLRLGLQVIIRVSTDKSAQSRQDFESAVHTWHEVLYCFALTGEADYLLHAFFTDMNAFFAFCVGCVAFARGRAGREIQLRAEGNQAYDCVAAGTFGEMMCR